MTQIDLEWSECAVADSLNWNKSLQKSLGLKSFNFTPLDYITTPIFKPIDRLAEVQKIISADLNT